MSSRAESLFGEAGKHSPWMEWQQLVDADPDVIVIAPADSIWRARTGAPLDDVAARLDKLRAPCTRDAINISIGPVRGGGDVSDSLRDAAPEQFPPTYAVMRGGSG